MLLLLLLLLPLLLLLLFLCQHLAGHRHNLYNYTRNQSIAVFHPLFALLIKKTSPPLTPHFPQWQHFNIAMVRLLHELIAKSISIPVLFSHLLTYNHIPFSTIDIVMKLSSHSIAALLVFPPVVCRSRCYAHKRCVFLPVKLINLCVVNPLVLTVAKTCLMPLMKSLKRKHHWENI